MTSLRFRMTLILMALTACLPAFAEESPLVLVEVKKCVFHQELESYYAIPINSTTLELGESKSVTIKNDYATTEAYVLRVSQTDEVITSKVWQVDLQSLKPILAAQLTLGTPENVNLSKTQLIASTSSALCTEKENEGKILLNITAGGYIK